MTQSALLSLKKEIPFRWKVQSARSWGCECVAYIDARQVMDLLDEVMGPENWQDHYREVAGNVYCDLSLQINDAWITKSDCGSQSNFEAEKGQASDAFKRAAVKWGIGRFLYSMASVRVKAVENGTDDRGKPRYAPADDQGRKIRDLTAYINSSRQEAATAATAEATPSQKEHIKSLCQTLDWTSEQLKSYLSTHQASWKHMTRNQASRLLTDLEAKVKQKSEPTQVNEPTQVKAEKAKYTAKYTPRI